MAVRFPVVRKALSEVEPHLREVLETLAHGPSAYLVKSYDVGPATDYHADYAWHSLAKERAVSWPYARRLGVLNPQTGLALTTGFAIDGGPLIVEPAQRTILHTIDLLAIETDIDPHVTATVTFAPYRSDTLLVVFQIENRGARRRRVHIEPLLFREIPKGEFPWRWQGVKVWVATRGSSDRVETEDGAGAIYEEWEDWAQALKEKAFGHLLAWVSADRPALQCAFVTPQSPTYAAERTALGLKNDEALYLHRQRYAVDVPAKDTASMALVVALRRFKNEDVSLVRGARPYMFGTRDDALRFCREAARQALEEDWPARVRQSLHAYARYPAYDVPPARWNSALLACLQLPRGNSLSPTGNLATPFYNFCRAFGNEWRMWWSYGMHAHEGLSISTTVAVDPQLAMNHLRGHFALQEPDGFIPYGANPVSQVGKRVFMLQGATPPFISWEAWLAYMWSGDKAWLAEAYAHLVRYHRYWLTYRDRTGEGLCCWLDNGETVRDNGRVPTWHWPGAPVFFQEALDLNCYLARQEWVLADMAGELGRADEENAYRQAFAQRARAINAWQWDNADRCYYGTCEAGDLIESVTPADPRRRPVLRLRENHTPQPLFVRVQDIGTLMPLWGGVAPVDRALRLVEFLRDEKIFAAPYPIPVLSMSNRSFGEGGISANWNGCTWLEMNLLIATGLRDYGLYQQAARLAHRTAEQGLGEVLRTGHFNEFYHPFTGEGLGLYEYIWACVSEALARDVLLGIRPAREGLEVLPALPDGWNRAAVRRLRVREFVADVVVVRSATAQETLATVNGQPWTPIVDGRGLVVPWSHLASAEGGSITITVVQPIHVPDRPRPPQPLPSDLLIPPATRSYIVPTAEELAFDSEFEPFGMGATTPPPVPWRVREVP